MHFENASPSKFCKHIWAMFINIYSRAFSVLKTERGISTVMKCADGLFYNPSALRTTTFPW